MLSIPNRAAKCACKRSSNQSYDSLKAIPANGEILQTLSAPGYGLAVYGYLDHGLRIPTSSAIATGSLARLTFQPADRRRDFSCCSVWLEHYKLEHEDHSMMARFDVVYGRSRVCGKIGGSEGTRRTGRLRERQAS